MHDVEKKLSAARTRLILDKPFLGALVLRLPLIEAQGSWCSTSATDARSLYYNPTYISPLSLSQVQFVLAHEALHCGLSHFARREHRDKNRWNLACDFAVNQLLLEDGLELPPGALHDDVYKGLSAEEIYPLIKQDTNDETMDQHLYDGQDGQDGQYENTGQDKNQNSRNQQPPSPKEDHGQQSRQQNRHESFQGSEHGARRNNNQKLELTPEQALRPLQESADNNQGADEESVQDSKRDAPDETLDRATQRLDSVSGHDPTRFPNPRVDEQAVASPPPPLSAHERERLNTQWQQRLAGAAQQASAAGKMNGSVARLVDHLLRSTVPWRSLLARYMSGSSRTDYNLMRPSQRRGGNAILPSLHAQQINVCIALDTSGSIEQEEIAEFVAEVNAIKGLVNARITLLACDSQLDAEGPWVYECWEQLTLPKSLKGNGGTDFCPVFDWMRAAVVPADLLIYFTDAQGRFPPQPPFTETLWLVKGAADVPWGQRIQLN